MSANYTLHGAEISYFTGKVRAYLRCKRIPFVEVPATAAVYREVILPRVGFPVIPVVVGPDGETLQDSTEIIDTLEQRFPEPTVRPATPVQALVAQLVELYADEWLVIPAMHYRWHHNREWALQAFGELNAPQASPEEQLAIGTRIAQPFARAAELLGAGPSMHAAVEKAYEGFLQEMQVHFSAHPFVLGQRPTLADFALYGPLYAHLYRDPASGALMRRSAPAVAHWVERLREGATPAAEAAPGRDEAAPASLLPLLRRVMREQMPVLAETARQVDAWVRERPGEPLPRTLGMHAFTLEGQVGQRIVRPYSLWMLQRARRQYVSLSGEQKAQADALLDAVEGEAFRSFADPVPLARHGLSVRPG